MKKKECLQLLGTVNHCYTLGILSAHYISTVKNESIPTMIPYENIQYPETGRTFDMSLIKKWLAVDQNKIQSVSEFTKSIIRTFIHNTYELVLQYAIETKQKNKIFTSELMIFVRFLRNNVGHDHKFRFKNEKDKQRLRNNPIRWRDKQITLEMEGKQISLDFIGPANVMDLYIDIINFVRDELN